MTVMNANQLSRCLAATLAALGLLLAACGPEGDPALGSATDALSTSSTAQKRDQGGVLICEHAVPPGPIDLQGLVVELEMDRVYQSARPGFMREWLPAGFKDGMIFGQFVTRFESLASAYAFSSWLENDFVIDGVHFWDRPEFSTGHSCAVYEVFGSEDRPSTADQQVTMRMERFPLSGPNVDQQLKSWYAQIRVQAQRSGDSSIILMYSAERQEAALMYFQNLPESQRVALGPVPVATHPPYVAGNTFDFSGWNLTVWSPYAPLDSGHPAQWPLPGITASEGDTMCSLSRHETYHTTTDCLPTCGNGVRDPGETPRNCPADVAL